MKKQYDLVKPVLIICLILTAIEVILLCMHPDALHIALMCVVAIFTIGVLICFIISYLEVRKIIFEGKYDEYQIRLVDYDDYQIVRQLMHPTPLENTKEEVLLLEEYDKITVDYVRMHYHYLVFKNDELKAIFHAQHQKKGKHIIITFIKVNDDDREFLNHYIRYIAEAKKYSIEFKG